MNVGPTALRPGAEVPALTGWLRLSMWLPLVWLLLPACLFAQDTTRVTIEGTLVDNITGDPVGGAEVSFRELDVHLRSDFSGSISLPDVPLGLYWLTISADGYRGTEGEFQVDRAGTFQIRLQPLDPPGERELGQVRGTVRDGLTGAALGSAQVSFPALARSALSDPQGQFLVTDISSGSLLMRTEHLGYGTRLDSISVSPGHLVVVEVELKVEPIELETLSVVVESRLLSLDVTGFYDRMETTFGIFLAHCPKTCTKFWVHFLCNFHNAVDHPLCNFATRATFV